MQHASLTVRYLYDLQFERHLYCYNTYIMYMNYKLWVNDICSVPLLLTDKRFQDENAIIITINRRDVFNIIIICVY